MAAQWLGVPPWELAGKSIAWLNHIVEVRNVILRVERAQNQ